MAKSGSSYTELESGLRLGGVWKELYDNCTAASQERDVAQAELVTAKKQIEDLTQKINQLNEDHKASLGSLTKHQTSNWQLESILQAIREEKESIESKCCAYETQIKWLDKQREMQKNEIHMKDREIQALTETNLQLQNELNSLNENNANLLNQLHERDQLLEFKDKKIESFEKMHSVLQKSLKIKEKQLTDQTKISQSLKETIEDLKKSILPKYRNIVFLKVQEGLDKAHNRKTFSQAATPEKIVKANDEMDHGNEEGESTDDEKFTPEKSKKVISSSTSSPNLHESDISIAHFDENTEIARLKNLLLLSRLECKAVKEELEFLKNSNKYTGCVRGALLKQRGATKEVNNLPIGISSSSSSSNSSSSSYVTPPSTPVKQSPLKLAAAAGSNIPLRKQVKNSM